VRVGAGAYICGEETSLLESLEGKPRRGARQAAAAGASRACSASPTVVNNVHHRWPRVPVILARGRRGLPGLRHGPLARHAAASSWPATSGTAGWSRRAFGVTLRELLDGLRRRHAPRAGRSARCRSAARWAPTCPQSQFDTPLDYEAFAAVGALVGHGGIVVFDDTVDMAQHGPLSPWSSAPIESCGKCTPCRIGSTRGVEVIDRIVAGEDRRAEHRSCSTTCARPMQHGSLCAHGRHDAVSRCMSALNHFPRISAARTLPRPRSRPHVATSHETDLGTPAAAGDATVTLTIDGVQVTVPAGTSIMRAAADAGTAMPEAVRHRQRSRPFGSCRLCLVEIEGRSGYPASCTTPVAPGMEVRTQTPKLQTAAQGRDGAVHLRPPARLPDLRRQWRLRAAGHGRRRSACARCATAPSGANHLDARPRTHRNPYFTYRPVEVHRLLAAACAPARRCRAPSR
jgi:hypothetical protein